MKPQIVEVRIEHKVDEDPRFDDLGKFTDKPEPWAIVRYGEYKGQYIANLPQDAELPQPDRYCRFFLPFAAGEEKGTADYQTYGLQDWKRMEAYERQEWQYIGVIAKANVRFTENTTQTVRSMGLWGVEDDAGDYLDEVAEEELALLRKELEGMRFGERAIDYAFKNVTRL